MGKYDRLKGKSVAWNGTSFLVTVTPQEETWNAVEERFANEEITYGNVTDVTEDGTIKVFFEPAPDDEDAKGFCVEVPAGLYAVVSLRSRERRS